jgi:phosphinothricin acetyltransferase
MGKSDPTVRPATAADLPAVRDIFNHYVLTSTCTFQTEPVTAEERRAWLTDRSAAHPVTVAELDGEVVGWAALSPWKPRGAYAHSVEASVYVRHDRHRRGIGRALLADLIGRARAAGHRTVIGGTCTEQAASLALQAAFGFEVVGRFRQVGYKFGRWLDVEYRQLLL